MKATTAVFISIVLIAFVGYFYLSNNRNIRMQEMTVQCSDAAKKWRVQQPESSAYKIDPYYVSHYNSSDGKCYVTLLEDWQSTTMHLLYSGFVYNVYENKMVLEDETSLEGSDIYAKYSDDAASSTQISEGEYKTLYKKFLSN